MDAITHLLLILVVIGLAFKLIHDYIRSLIIALYKKLYKYFSKDREL